MSDPKEPWRSPSHAINSDIFDVNKLDSTNNFADGADALANKGMVVTITHVPSGRSIYFKAFIMSYNETFSPDWSSETVYGRADPIYQFKNTTRNITVGLAIPAASESEAFENLAKVQALTQFLYPNYSQAGIATTISQSPLLRLGLMNLARSQKAWAPKLTHYVPDPNRPGSWILGETPGTKYTEQQQGMVYKSMGGGTGTEGLLGILKSLTINHNLNSDKGVVEVAPGPGGHDAGVLPKLIEINFDFGVIHEHHLGWDEQGQFSNNAFPYGIDYQTSAGVPYPQPPPASTTAQDEQTTEPDPAVSGGAPGDSTSNGAAPLDQTPEGTVPADEVPQQAADNAAAQAYEALPPYQGGTTGTPPGMDPWDPDIDTAAEYAQEARLRGFEVDELAMRQSVPGYGSGEGGSSASEGDY
jgi:hypothetical protein